MGTYRLIGTWWPSLTITGHEYPANQGGVYPMLSAGMDAASMACYQNYTKGMNVHILGTYTFTSAAVPGISYAPFTVGWDEVIPVDVRSLFTTAEEVLEGLAGMAHFNLDTSFGMDPSMDGPFNLYTTPPSGQLQGRRENFRLEAFVVVGSSLDEFFVPTEPYIMYMPDELTYSMFTVFSAILKWDEIEVADDGLGTETTVARERWVGNVVYPVVGSDSSGVLLDIVGSFSADGITGSPVSPGWGFTQNIHDDSQSGPYGAHPDVTHVEDIEQDCTITVTSWLTVLPDIE